jgi:uncharacterized membrane protein
VNTVVFFLHEQAWKKLPAEAKVETPPRRSRPFLAAIAAYDPAS